MQINTETNKHRASLSISKEDWEKVKSLADKEGYSASAFIMKVVNEYKTKKRK